MAHDAKDKFRFLDLPIEIRLEIHSHLLIARQPHHGVTATGETVVWVEAPSRAMHRPYSTSFSFRLAHPQRQIVNIRPIFLHSYLRAGEVPGNSLAPRILQSCWQIYHEAVSILYRQNVFTFCLLQPGNPYSYPPKTDALKAMSQDVLERHCSQLYNCGGSQEWQAETPPILGDSVLACFLRQVGAKNASMISSLSLKVDDPRSLRIATPLLKSYATRLRQIAIVYQPNIWEEESPADISGMVGYLVHQIPWLVHLDFNEFASMGGIWVKDALKVFPEIVKLITLVDSRAGVRRLM